MEKSKVKRCFTKASVLLTVIFMTLSSGLLAQTRTITGTVTDPDGATLPGVTVVVKGTTIGTATNMNGVYSLSVPGPDVVLRFSYVGFMEEEIEAGERTVINVTLMPSLQMLSEMVVVGYGTRMKEELTGAVSTISNQQLQSSSAPSVISRLQGQASGVTVTTANRPGGEAIIRIRGIGTINNSDPLFIIDGVPTGPGNNLNPNDIESISILKDASSTAIYGTRGANGVVIITTKRGQFNQKPKLTFSFKTGANNPTNQYEMLNTQEYGEALWLSSKNRTGTTPNHSQYGSGANPSIPDYILPAGAMEGDASVNPSLYRYPEYQIYRANKEGTNWYDEIYRPGWMQEYDLSVAGGGQNSNYAFSGSYLNEDGYIIHTNFKRYTLRMNADAKLNDWFKVGESLQVIYIDENGRFTDNAEDSPISDAYRMQPIIPVYDIERNFAGSRASEMGNAQNPVARLYRERNNNGNWARMMGNAYVQANPLKNLTFRSLIGFNYGQWNYKGHIIPNFDHSEPNRVNGLNVDSNFGLQWNWTNTVNFNTTLTNGHRLNFLAGTEAVQSTYRFLNASRRQFFSEDPNYMQLDVGEANRDNSGNLEEWALLSQFGRVNYDIGTKYFLEGSIRRDGSSRFSKNNQWGLFPAASAAWAISEEGFMAATNNWLDLLKIRLGWGQVGNDRIDDYNSFTTFRSDPYRSGYALDGSNTSALSGFMPSRLGNEDTTWEATTTTNVGIDGALLNNKFRFSFDLWDRFTSGMLFQRQIPFVEGVVDAPFLNQADMKNQGFDLELGYNDQAMAGRFTYSITATISRYTNEIVDLTGDPDLILNGEEQRQMVYTRYAAGRAFPEFYGYIVDGIFQTEAEAAAHPQYGNTDYNQPGHFKFRDVSGPDGVPDGKITPDDRTWIGSPHPDFVGGLNFDLSYGNWDLNMFWYGSYGNDVINYVTRWIDYGMFNGGLSKRALYESWGSPYLSNNADASLPMLDQNTISQQPSSAFIEDGSYLRLKNLRLGYTVPQSALQAIGFGEQSVRAYVQASNLITFTKYKGLDPEINLGGNSMGVDRGAWPTARMIMFGINVGI
jgi:TonB-dependent starch-binding outer membrane protein SusC